MTVLENLNQEQIKAAVVALYEFSRTKESNDLLSSEEADMMLHITTKTIPLVNLNRSAGGKKIKAKHSVYASDANVCIFVKDEAQKLEENLREEGLKNVTVLGMEKLKHSYSTFEKRRKLADAHDVFFVDDRIISFMPKLLGTVFLKRLSKTPIPVNIKVKHRGAAVKAALCTQLYRVSPGTTFVLRAGTLGLSEDEMVENVVSILESLCSGKVAFGNIQELTLKLQKGPVLPFYNSLPEH